MLNEYESRLYNFVKKIELRNSLLSVKEATDTIWSEEVRIIKDYTDHGSKHSHRIFEKLYEVLSEKQQYITEEEWYLLILAVYLHDIGMQCDIKKHKDIKKVATDKFNAVFTVDYKDSTANSYSTEEQNEIRKNHHLLTAAWLYFAYNNRDSILSGPLKKVNSIYIEDLIHICMFHSKLNIMDCVEKTDVNKVRRRFIAALLRFGDELDIDQYRVKTDTVKEFGYEVENRVYWFLHNITNIKIVKNEVIITITLNPEDYPLCHSTINKLIILEFKQKNKILTDILTKNDIPVFISEDSNVISYEYAERLTNDELNLIIDLGKKKIEQETESNFKLINILNDKIKKNQDITSIIAGEPNEFANNYSNYVEAEANKIFEMIQELKNRYLISKEDLSRAKDVFNHIAMFDYEQVINHMDDINNGFKAYLFIQAFNTKQMKFLYDLGQSLHIQVINNKAQVYARDFFTYYFSRFVNYPDDTKKIIERFDYYTFEQINRIIADYETIINFNFAKVKFSQGYIYKSEKYGVLLAASVEGESNKIFVWDINSGLYEPIAALGGLYEEVKKLNIIRHNGNIFISAKGNRQIYLWLINSNNEKPAYIFRSSDLIIDYAVVNSINGELHVIGASEEDIYIWKMGSNENPVKIFEQIKESEDIIIIDTKLEEDCPSFTLIGDSSCDSVSDSNIFELREASSFNYEISLLNRKKNILRNYNKEMFNFAVNDYQITTKNKILGVLFENSLFLYDIQHKKNLYVIPQEGQKFLGFQMIDKEREIYVLTYKIYNRLLDNGEGLVHCYMIRDGKLVQEKEWFPAKYDMKKAVFVKNMRSFYIFFNQYNDNVIYRTEYEKDEYEEFFKLPKSMKLIDLVSG